MPLRVTELGCSGGGGGGGAVTPHPPTALENVFFSLRVGSPDWSCQVSSYLTSFAEVDTFHTTIPLCTPGSYNALAGFPGNVSELLAQACNNLPPLRGATALLVAGCNSTVAQARYCNAFQLTHMPREDHVIDVDQLS